MTDTNVQQKNGIERCGHLLFGLRCCEELECCWCFAGGIVAHTTADNRSSCSNKDDDLESAPVYSLRTEYDQELRRVTMTEQSKIAATASPASMKKENGFVAMSFVVLSSLFDWGIRPVVGAVCLWSHIIGGQRPLSALRFWSGLN